MSQFRAVTVVVLLCILSSVVPRHAQAQALPYLRLIASQCGHQALAQMQSLATSIIADMDSTDNAALLQDSRRMIRVTDACLPHIPECIDGTCDDSAEVFLQANMMLAQREVAGTMDINQQSSAEVELAIGNWFDTALYLCKFPHLRDNGPPFSFALEEVTRALNFAARMHTQYQGSDSPAESRLSGFQSCADTLDLSLDFS